jgi:hypothetical protein
MDVDSSPQLDLDFGRLTNFARCHNEIEEEQMVFTCRTEILVEAHA